MISRDDEVSLIVRRYMTLYVKMYAIRFILRWLWVIFMIDAKHDIYIPFVVSSCQATLSCYNPWKEEGKFETAVGAWWSGAFDTKYGLLVRARTLYTASSETRISRYIKHMRTQRFWPLAVGTNFKSAARARSFSVALCSSIAQARCFAELANIRGTLGFRTGRKCPAKNAVVDSLDSRSRFPSLLRHTCAPPLGSRLSAVHSQPTPLFLSPLHQSAACFILPVVLLYIYVYTYMYIGTCLFVLFKLTIAESRHSDASAESQSGGRKLIAIIQSTTLSAAAECVLYIGKS